MPIDCPIAIHSPSWQHAAIVHSSDREAFLIDLGSASGTSVDAVRAVPHKPHALADGAVIKLGDSTATYTFRVVTAGGGKQGGKRKR